MMSVCFLFGIYAVGNDQFAIVATFTAAALLGIADLSGDLGDRLRANAATLVAGAVLIAVGTAVSTSTVAATVTMFIFALIIGFSTIFSGYFTAASNAVIVFYVVATGVEAPPSAIPAREAGLLFGGTLSVAAAGWLWPTKAPTVARRRLADVYRVLGESVAAIPRTGAEGAGLSQAILAAEQAIAGSAWQPTGLARPQKARVYLLQGAQRLAALIDQLSAMPEAPDPSMAVETRALIDTAATALAAVGAALAGPGATLPDPRRIEEAKLKFGEASERHFERCAAAGVDAGDPAAFAAHVFALHQLSWGAILATVHCRVVFGAPLDASARTEESVLVSALSTKAGWRAKWLRRARRNLTLRSVHLRNSIRLATGLALARLMVGLLDLQHGFWVGFATLVVLKTSAAGTRATATQATLGTAIGFLASLFLVLTFGVHAPVYSVVLPLVAFAAFYLPGAVSFVLGQAFFTVTIVVLFNLIKPEGWAVGLVRFEDVAVGAAIGLVIGLAVWPQGASLQLAQTTGALVVAASAYAGATMRSRIGTAVGTDDVDECRYRAAVAAVNAEDTFSQYLAEPHQRNEPIVAWSAIMGVAHRVWFGASVVEIVRLPPGCAETLPVLTQVVDDEMAATTRNHQALAVALTTGKRLQVEDHAERPVEPTTTAPLSTMKLLELRSWAEEMNADVASVVSAVALVSSPGERDPVRDPSP